MTDILICEGCVRSSLFALHLQDLMTVLSNAGEEEEEGYSDEYTLEDLEVGAGDYVKQEGVPDFRSAWDEMDDSTELADSYGLGQRDSMQEAVEAVIAILGMQVILFTTGHFMSVRLMFPASGGPWRVLSLQCNCQFGLQASTHLGVL